MLRRITPFIKKAASASLKKTSKRNFWTAESVSVSSAIDSVSKEINLLSNEFELKELDLKALDKVGKFAKKVELHIHENPYLRESDISIGCAIGPFNVQITKRFPE